VSGNAQSRDTCGGETLSENIPQGDQRGTKRDSPDKSQAAGAEKRLPTHKERVSARRKQALIRHLSEAKPEHFHRYRHAESPTENQFLYFDPSVGGPERRVPGTKNPSDVGDKDSPPTRRGEI
jgi:hypothetical protein